MDDKQIIDTLMGKSNATLPIPSAPIKEGYTDTEIMTMIKGGPVIKKATSNPSDPRPDWAQPAYEGSAPFLQMWGTSWLKDPIDSILVLGRKRFPGLNDRAILERYKVEDGNIMYYDDEGAHPEFGESIPDKMKGFVATMSGGYLPVAVASTAGEFIGGVPGAFIGGVVGEGARRAVGEGLVAPTPDKSLSEESLMADHVGGDIDYTESGADMVLEGVLAAGGAGAMKVGTGLINKMGRVGTGTGPIGKMAQKDLEFMNSPGEVARIRRLYKQHGITPTLAELLGSREVYNALIELKNMPYSADIFADWMKVQRNPQVYDAVYNFLGQISPEGSVLAAAEGGREAAKKAIGMFDDASKSWTGLAGTRARMAEPFYQKAFQINPDVDLKPVRGYIFEMLKNARGSGRKALIELNKMLNVPGGRKLDSSLLGAHNIKLAIDEMLEAKATSETSLGSTTRGWLQKTKETLLAQMDKAEPAGGWQSVGMTQNPYSVGKGLFEIKSKVIEEAEKSMAGRMTKKAYDGPAAIKVIDTLFDPKESSVEAITSAKKLIMSENPDAWWALVRGRLQREFESVNSRVATGEFRNMAGIWKNEVFGSETKKKMLEAAMEGHPVGLDALNNFMEVMERSGAMFVRNSGTPAGQATRDIMKKEMTGLMPSIVRKAKAWDWPEQLASYLEARNLAKNQTKIIKALLSPKGAQAIRRIKGMNPDTEEYTQALGTFLVLSSIYGGRYGKFDHVDNPLFLDNDHQQTE